MSTRRPIGSSVSPREALLQAADALCPPFEVAAAGETMVELADPTERLPETTLSLEKERRLFSRTLALVVEAATAGRGPSEAVGAAIGRQGLRRRWALRPSATSAAAGQWAGRLELAGLLEGVQTMTHVGALEATWDPARGMAHLRLVTLAGALIGTTPTTSVAIPLEPEDVTGLLRILAALRDGARR